MGRPKPGDGSAQPRVRWRDFMIRTTLAADVPDPSGVLHRYAVKVGIYDDSPNVRLYADGIETAIGGAPVTFEVPGARIEVAVSAFGIKRAHVLTQEGKRTSEQMMTPLRGTAEHARGIFARRFPWTSRLIGAIAVVICLAGVIVGLPAAAELLTSIDAVAERVGSFDSPFDFPRWVDVSLFVAGLIAATERALSLRNHWLIDADTWILGP